MNVPLHRRLARAIVGLALALPALAPAAASASAPDLAALDLAALDLAALDLAAPDLPGTPELAAPELAAPDLAATPDLPSLADPPPDSAPISPPADPAPPEPAPQPVPPDSPPPVQRPASLAPSVQRPTALAPAPTPAPPVPSASPPTPVPSASPPTPVPSASPPPPVPSTSPAPAPAPADSTPPVPSPTAPASDDPPARNDPKRWRHGGFIVDLQIGTGGCTRRYCGGSSGHDAAPGVRLGGFVGGNIFGIIEVGISAGWNTLRPRGVAGQNALTLYGLDPAQVQVAIAEAMGVPALAVDLSTLTVQSASSRAFDIGPSLRVHFIRKGRGIAYVGADIHYQLWRNRYSTASGDLRLDFHGVSAPLRAGGGVYVHRNLAIIGEFSYVPTVFVVGGIRHPMLSAVAPLQALEGQAADVGSSGSLKSGLPHFWNLSINLRLRF